MFEAVTKKKSMLAVIVAVACAMVVLSGLTGCQFGSQPPESDLTPQLESGTTITDGTLTVGINASNSPYGGTNSSNETIGLDVDVAAAIADELGMKLQIVDVNSNGRSALANKKVDVAMGLTKSGNSDQVSYTSAYINDGASLYCLSKNKPSSLSGFKEALGDGKVIVQGETAAAYEVQEALGSDSIQACSTMQEAFEALERGDQKFLVADAVIGDYFARNYSDAVRVDFLSSNAVAPIYAVTLTSNSEVSSKVSQAIDTITQNGVLRVIMAKWLGSDASTLLPGQVDISKLPSTSFGVETTAQTPTASSTSSTSGNSTGDDTRDTQTSSGASGGGN